MSSNRLERSTVNVEASSLVKVNIPTESIVPVEIALASSSKKPERSIEFPPLIDKTLALSKESVCETPAISL